MEILTQSLKDYVVETRRALHRIPELSEAEFKTSAFIENELKNLGIKYRKIHTGIYADIVGENKKGLIALRCDMDALPIQETNDVNFKAPTYMHACGHDGHMTIILTLARLLTLHKPSRSVRLIFQFGEEGCGGAQRMIEGGVLDGVEKIYAFHLCPELEKGRMASTNGPMFAGAVEFDVVIKGKAAHCADREKGIDCVAALSKFLQIYFETSSKYSKNTLLHVGALNAGAARNIVAETAVANCTLRYFDDNHRESIMMELMRALLKIDGEFKTSSDIVVQTVYPPLINSGEALLFLKRIAPIEECKPKYTAEDFAFYLQKISGCMVWLGTYDEKYFSPLHSDTFGFDESALFLGIETMYKLVM